MTLKSTSGDAQVVSSDHRSFGTEQRALGRNDFRLIAPGVSSVQERMEVTWSVAVVRIVAIVARSFYSKRFLIRLSGKTGTC